MHYGDRLDTRGRGRQPWPVLKPNSYERKAMTLCIAAACQHEGKPAIILCADCQGSYGEYIKDDSQTKIRNMGNARLMFAGSESAADETVILLTPIFEAYDLLPKDSKDFDLRINKLLSDIRKALQIRKAEITRHRLAIDYNVSKDGFDFFQFSELERTAMLEKIKKEGLGASLIIAYAEDFDTILIRTDNSGNVSWESNYIAIGTGEDIALAILSQNDYDDLMPFMECMARVLAAKRAAEKGLYVGQSTMLEFLLNGRKAHLVTDKGWDYLKAETKLVDSQKHLVFQADFIEPNE